MVGLFERYLFRRIYERRKAALAPPGKRWSPPEGVQGFDTLWRVAAFLESALDEEEAGGLWDVPRPPEWTLKRRSGNASDVACLAQALLGASGKEGLLLTVYDGAFRTKHVVCAVPEDGVWHHISLQGMFGVYGDLAEIADDLAAGWGLYVARDTAMQIVAWQRPKAGA